MLRAYDTVNQQFLLQKRISVVERDLSFYELVSAKIGIPSWILHILAQTNVNHCLVDFSFVSRDQYVVCYTSACGFYISCCVNFVVCTLMLSSRGITCFHSRNMDAESHNDLSMSIHELFLKSSYVML